MSASTHAQPRLIKTIEPAEVMGEGHYSRPHTVHCGPGGLFVSALGSGSIDGNDGPAGHLHHGS